MSHRYIPKNIFSIKQPKPKLNVSWIELRFFLQAKWALVESYFVQNQVR